MPRPIYDAQADIPKGFEEEYVERDDKKWHPKSPEELGDKGKETLAKERKARADEKARADALEAERDALKLAADAAKKGITEAELQKIRDDEAKARKPLEDKATALEAENRKLKLTDKVRAQFAANGGMTDREEDAMDQLAKRTDLGDAGGIVYKDKTGNITAQTEKEFFEAFKIEKPWLFKGTNSSGSSAEQSEGGGGGGYDPVAAGKAKAKEQVGARESRAVGLT